MTQLPRNSADADLIPDDLRADIVKFLVDKGTGNVTLSVKDGQVLGARFEEVKSYRGKDRK